MISERSTGHSVDQASTVGQAGGVDPACAEVEGKVGDGDRSLRLRQEGRPFRLPESLDAFYPPAAVRPVYLLKMLSLETSFSGIIADLMEDDLNGARESFDDFQHTVEELGAGERLPRQAEPGTGRVAPEAGRTQALAVPSAAGPGKGAPAAPTFSQNVHRNWHFC